MSDAKPAAEAKPADAAHDDKKEKKKGGMMGPVLAVVVLVGIGVGMGMGVSSLLGTARGAEAEKGKEHGHDAHGGEGHPTIDPHKTAEITIGDLVTNIPNQAGRRYVKVQCVVWVESEDAEKIDAGGGEHGGSAPNVKKLLQMALEDRLKNYSLEDLTAKGVLGVLRQDFEQLLDKELRAYFGTGEDRRYIKRVVLNNLLVQ